MGLKYRGGLKLWDLGWREFLGGQGLYQVVSEGTVKLSSWQRRVVRLFMLVFVGLSFVLILMFLRSSSNMILKLSKR